MVGKGREEKKKRENPPELAHTGQTIVCG